MPEPIGVGAPQGNGAGEGAAEAGPAQAQARQLARDIHELRSAARRIADLVAARVDGRLAGMERALAGRGHGGRFAAVPSRDILDAVERALRAVKVKPEKGRVKDLVRLRRFCDALAELLEEDEES